MEFFDALPVVEERMEPGVEVLDHDEEDEDDGAVDDPEEECRRWRRLWRKYF